MRSFYRGRIAPSPTGYLHLGHARTFWLAMERARASEGTLVYREEDLDFNRCNKKYSKAAIEDLSWFGLEWQEGITKADQESFKQSNRINIYLDALEKLKKLNLIYPCNKSRQDIKKIQISNKKNKTEPIYPEHWRADLDDYENFEFTTGYNWRFRIPNKKNICFNDERLGPCQFKCGEDFGDFIVWRKDGIPSYELAVVVDDIKMKISEVVRGEDLLISTARQILIYNALGFNTPKFYHAPLLVDSEGIKLSKTKNSMALRELKQLGFTPNSLRECEEWWSGIDD